VPALTPLVSAISMDVSATLVGAGFIYKTLQITSATNASPIVLGFSQPHLYTTTASVTITGVVGNTNANGFWLAKIVDDTHVALYSATAIGDQVASSGNANYVSGGQCQTAFADGGFVIGQVRVEENIDLPRVIFIPKKSAFSSRSTPSLRGPSLPNTLAAGAGIRVYVVSAQGVGYAPTDTITVGDPDVSGGTPAQASIVVDSGGHIIRVVPTVIGSGYKNVPVVSITTSTGSGFSATPVLDYNSELLAQLQQRGIFTESVTFEVQVWGAQSDGPNYDDDFNAVQVIYQQIISSAWLLASGQVTPGNGRWLESTPSATQVDLRGHVFAFDLTIDTPVLDQPLQYADPQVQPEITTTMQGSDTGTNETGWTNAAPQFTGQLGTGNSQPANIEPGTK